MSFFPQTTRSLYSADDETHPVRDPLPMNSALYSREEVIALLEGIYSTKDKFHRIQAELIKHKINQLKKQTS